MQAPFRLGFSGKNIIWAPIDYGLAPEYKMEQIVSHVRQAVCWIYQNIKDYGGDPNKFIFMESLLVGIQQLQQSCQIGIFKGVFLKIQLKA